MKIAFLGTGAAVSNAKRDNTSLLIFNNQSFLIDCPGAIINKLSKINFDFKKIDKVIITHLHPDHVYGLPSLIHSQYKLNNKLKIFGSPETIKFVNKLIEVYNLDNEKRYPKIEYVNVNPSSNDTVYEDDEMKIICYEVLHAPESIGLKITFKNDRLNIGYTADTGPSKLVIDKNRDNDYLIHDCLCPLKFINTFPSLDIEHTSAYSLGMIAKEANVKNLIPIHFSTEVDFSIDELIDEIRLNFDGNIIIPNDLDIFELE